jgi:hypothetical protein
VNDPRDLDRLLRPGVEPLPAPPGAFDRIRRTASRRRGTRAAVSATAAALLIGVAVAAALQVWGGGDRVVVEPAGRPSATTTSPPSATPKPAVSPAPSAVAGSPPPKAVAPPVAGSPSGTAVAPRCESTELSVALGRVEPAAGNRYATMVFTNVGRRLCHLQGYPGASVLDADMQQLGPAATYGPGNPHVRLELRPGSKVSTVLHWASDAAGACQPESTYLRVYPPGETHPLIIEATIQLCGDILDVRNLTVGTDGIAG